MKLYFIENKGKQEGPFTVSELKSKKILDKTLVWTEGLDEWAFAEDIDELKAILISSPPPLPQRKTPLNQEETLNFSIGIKSPFQHEKGTQKKALDIKPKYDDTYEKETSATVTGFVIILFQILIVGGGIKFGSDYAMVSIMSLILRIIVTIWVVNIVKGQNRNQTSWGFFAFFFPPIALIFAGLQKKIFKSDETSFEKIKNGSILKEIAPFANDKNHSINNFSITIDQIKIPQKLNKEIHVDSTFLKYSIKETERYMKYFKSREYPFYAAIILDSRNEVLSPELLNNLSNVAQHYFNKKSINEVLLQLKSD